MKNAKLTNEIQNTLNLEPEDYQIVAAALLVTALGGGIAGAVPNVISVYTYLLGTALFAGTFGLTLVYRARSLWGGRMQRYMDLIAIGAGIHAVIFVPATYWVLQGAPAWLGTSNGAWFVLFHGASLLGVLLIMRGVYLLWNNEVKD